MSEELKHKNSKANEILSLYTKEKWSPALEEKVQGWLVSDDGIEGKDAALWDLFNDCDEAQGSEDEAAEMFADLSSRLALSEQAPAPVRKKNSKPFLKLNKIWIGVAAVILVAAGLTVILMRKSAPVEPNLVTFSVPEKETREITLPDGTLVRLKESSSCSYADNYPEDRKVYLTGEALFDVVKGDNPFILEAGDLSVSVFGTKFNVRNYDYEELQSVALVRGAVSVRMDKEEIKMVPETQVILNKESKSLNVEPFDEFTLLQINGELLHFDGIQLDEVFERIKYKYGNNALDIETGSDFSTINVNVNFNENEDLENVLVVLQTIAPVFECEHRNDSLFITAVNNRH